MQVTTVAVAVTVGASGDIAGTVAGAGAVADNLHSVVSRAVIENSTVTATGAVTVDAADTTLLDSEVVSASASVAIGSTAAFALGVSVVLATNDISGTTEAGILNSTVVAGGVDVTTDTQMSILSTGVAASLSLAAGDIAITGAGAGAASLNTLNNTLAARISNSDVTSSSGVDVYAEDRSSITSTVVASSTGLAISSGGSAAISAAMAVSIADNDVNTDLRAAIENGSLITANGDVNVTALADGSVDANAVAASISVGGVVPSVSAPQVPAVRLPIR